MQIVELTVELDLQREHLGPAVEGHGQHLGHGMGGDDLRGVSGGEVHEEGLERSAEIRGELGDTRERLVDTGVCDEREEFSSISDDLSGKVGEIPIGTVGGDRRVDRGGIEPLDPDPAPHRYQMVAVLAEDERRDIAPVDAVRVGEFTTEPHGVRMRSDTDHAMPADGPGEDRDTEFDRVGLHEHGGWWARSPGEGLRVLREHAEVGAGQLEPIGRGMRIGGDGRSRQHHHDVGVDALGFVDELDGRGVIGERVAQVGAEPVQLVFADPASMTHQLQPTSLRKHPAFEDGDGELSSAGAGGAHDGDTGRVHRSQRHGRGMYWSILPDLATPSVCARRHAIFGV